MKQMLGSSESLRFNNEEIYTHHIPVRWVTRDDLDNLSRYVSDANQNSMNTVHFNLMQEERIIGYGPTPEHMSMTEWDLLEIWRILVDKQAPEYRYWLIDDNGTVPRHGIKPTWLKTFFGTDKDFSFEYFTNQGLKITEEQWEKCQAISRT